MLIVDLEFLFSHFDSDNIFFTHKSKDIILIDTLTWIPFITITRVTRIKSSFVTVHFELPHTWCDITKFSWVTRIPLVTVKM